jgi:hypothetical protein
MTKELEQQLAPDEQVVFRAHFGALTSVIQNSIFSIALLFLELLSKL